MKCPYCESTDIANIQGQLYCINCGRQVQQTDAAKPAVDKLAASAQEEVNAALSELTGKSATTKTTKEALVATGTSAIEKASSKTEPKALKPAESPSKTAETVTDTETPSLIINHNKGKKLKGSAPTPSVSSTVSKVELNSAKPKAPTVEPLVDTKAKNEPEKTVKPKQKVEMVMTKPTTEKKEARAAEQKQQINPQTMPTKHELAIMYIPAVAAAFITSLPMTLLRLWSEPSQLHELLSNWHVVAPASNLMTALVRVGIIASTLGVFMYAYKLYVVAAITHGSAKTHEGKSVSQVEWRKVARRSLGRLLFTDTVMNLLITGALIAAVYMAHLTLSKGGDLSFSSVSLLFVVNTIGFSVAFLSYVIKTLARYEIVVGDSRAKNALKSASNDLSLNLGYLFGRWLKLLVAELLIWSPVILLGTYGSKMPFLSDATTGSIVTFVLSSAAGAITIVFSTRYWLKTYRELPNTSNPTRISKATPSQTSTMFKVLGILNTLLLASLAAWAWVAQNQIIELVTKLLVRS